MDANTTRPSENNRTDAANAAPRTDADIVEAPSYDEPYSFGRRPTSRAPFPFTEREFARLLIVRGRVHAEHFSSDALEA
jgi:hypothetical protein